MQDLQYSVIVGSLFAAVPEAEDEYEKWRSEVAGEPLPYTVFGLVLEPFIKTALNTNADHSLLRRAFAFLEEMAHSKDIEVVNLLYVSFFEAWLGEPETLVSAWKYMGDSTKAVARDAARRLNRVHNLPNGK